MMVLDQVTYERGGRAVVRDVCHAFTPGRVTALLGANGAGKSSLVRLLSGEARPHAGRVRWRERCLTTCPVAELARCRAVVSQFVPSPFAFRAIDLVLLGRLPHNRHPDAHDLAIATRALEQVGLVGFGERSIDTLSGGERQRVHVARALAQLHEARRNGQGILLLDEPTAHLDLVHQQRILQIAREVAAEGVAVLVVLHDVNLAAAYADEVMLMRDGRLLAVGAVAMVMTCPLLREALLIDLTRVNPEGGRPVFVPTPDALPPEPETRP
ncbi:MAG TPA: ATP-binding cassette domain-containing protein [Kiritimatiellia bacterium]|nr:ATP-binding cassette domain-containing protein [Kiritimatiellia bacterium]HMP33226.1 ATP-binding cassette domain-containing protein [Kiritimatiellia bacterium]